MGAIKSYLHEWLENWGHNLGYSMSNAPDFSDLDKVAEDQIKAEKYWENK